MISTIYVENDVRQHPRTQRILARFPEAGVVEIERYGEVFNRRTQNFRLQKKMPALIIAQKHDGHVLKTPPGYGIGGHNNYYFSHLLNCVYDCRYCFLQGMYPSANYVLFVNYEDFLSGIDSVLASHPNEDCYFFSGYDCDSLALESITGFVEDILPWLKSKERAWLELRTKSIQTKPLLNMEAFERVIAAFSLTPSAVAQSVEYKAPSVERRIDALGRLADHGWPIGLRFDPLIVGRDWRNQYQKLFDDVFKRVPSTSIHSVSYGPLRFPKAMYKDIVKLYPDEPVFAHGMSTETGMVAYPDALETEMAEFCREALTQYVPDSVFFQCTPEQRT